MASLHKQKWNSYCIFEIYFLWKEFWNLFSCLFNFFTSWRVLWANECFNRKKKEPQLLFLKANKIFILILLHSVVSHEFKNSPAHISQNLTDSYPTPHFNLVTSILIRYECFLCYLTCAMFKLFGKIQSHNFSFARFQILILTKEI